MSVYLPAHTTFSNPCHIPKPVVLRCFVGYISYVWHICFLPGCNLFYPRHFRFFSICFFPDLWDCFSAVQYHMYATETVVAGSQWLLSWEQFSLGSATILIYTELQVRLHLKCLKCQYAFLEFSLRSLCQILSLVSERSPATYIHVV